MKDKSPNKLLFFATVLIVLSSFSLTSAQGNQTNQINNSSQQSGLPKAIDISSYDKAIELAGQILKVNPNKKANKKRLAAAYAARGFALVDAAQYKSALGDLRRCLKLNPKDKRTRAMHDQIIDIYKSLDIEPPAECKEPPPIPFIKN